MEAPARLYLAPFRTQRANGTVLVTLCMAKSVAIADDNIDGYQRPNSEFCPDCKGYEIDLSKKNATALERCS